jgi:hypothetical protein
MTPNTGVSGTVDYIAGKMVLDGKQDAKNNLGVNSKPMSNFKPTTHVSSFKILNALNVVRIPVLPCVMLHRLSSQNIQKGCNPMCTSSRILLYHVNYMFLFPQFIDLGSSERRIPLGETLFSKVLERIQVEE